METIVFLLIVGVAVLAFTVFSLLKRTTGEFATGKLEKLEATLKERLDAGSDLTAAKVGERFEVKHRELSEQLFKQEMEVRQAIERLKADTAKTLGEQQVKISEAMAQGATRTNHTLQETMKLATDTLNKRFAELQGTTDKKLTEISGKVAERLDEGFKKTNATFTDVIKRLAIIDQAQKKITDLSEDVVSLQDILSDKQSRGVFGEVQLSQLVRNAMPEGSYKLQHDLGNGKRADCVLFLPDPTGTVAIDAKFPLENYRRMFDRELPEAEKAAAMRLFKQDVKNHILTIAEKYIIPNVTSDYAMMFLPAEAVFAEIHAHHPDLVELSYKKRVGISSPTTLMAILTTARAVIKDEKTREQVHIIQEHLGGLARDFGRFGDRMDKLATHIRQAHEDTEQVHTSAKKITSRFEKIEKVQLEEKPEAAPKEMEAGGSEQLELP